MEAYFNGPFSLRAWSIDAALLSLFLTACDASELDGMADSSLDGAAGAAAMAAELGASVAGEAQGSPRSSLSDPDAITRAQDALPGVFIPPYLDCREPLDGRPGEGPAGEVCTHVAISASTELC